MLKSLSMFEDGFNTIYTFDSCQRIEALRSPVLWKVHISPSTDLSGDNVRLLHRFRTGNPVLTIKDYGDSLFHLLSGGVRRYLKWQRICCRNARRWLPRGCDLESSICQTFPSLIGLFPMVSDYASPRLIRAEVTPCALNTGQPICTIALANNLNRFHSFLSLRQ